MEWEIEFTDEFGEWWDGLTAVEQDSARDSIRLLMLIGPSLSRPHSDTLKDSRHRNMKELRVQHEGDPYRVFYAFDPRRAAILLIGGNKRGDDRFYQRMIPLADSIYDEHLAQLRKEEK